MSCGEDEGERVHGRFTASGPVEAIAPTPARPRAGVGDEFLLVDSWLTGHLAVNERWTEATLRLLTLQAQNFKLSQLH